MHDPVYRGGCRHGVGEHLLPLGEDKVGGDAQRAALVALGYQGEQRLRLAGSLWQVAKVVYYQQVEVSVLIVKPDRPDKMGSRSRAVSPREFLDGPRR